jgi:hypothetical protein
MEVSLFDTQAHNVATLARLQSLSHAEQEYIADPFVHYLFPRSSFLGRVIIWIYCICELFGWLCSHNILQTALKTSQIALEQLNTFLVNPSEEPSAPVSTFLSLSFDKRWKQRLFHVHHLFNARTSLPPFEKAQRAIAPIILQEITRCPIPWELFDLLFHQKLTDGPAQQRLQEWIEDVEMWGAFISPSLFLSICEAAAHRYFPEASLGAQSSHTFLLAWTLYKAGLTQLAAPDIKVADAPDEIIVTNERTEGVHCSTSIPILFPFDFPISAYAIEGTPHLMAIKSSVPLLLGMWVHNIHECSSPVPCIQIESCDRRGRHVVAERLTSSLEADIWECDGVATPHDRTLLDAISGLVTTLIKLPCTLDIELDHLFLTSSLEIRIISPLQTQHSFFCLAMVEKLIRSLCHEDETRLRYVFETIGLRSHPAAIVYRSLVEKFSFAATDPDIRRELRVFDLDDRNFSYVAEWVRTARHQANRARDQLKGFPQFLALSQREQMAYLSRAFLAFQQEIGCVSYVPPDLSERLVSRIQNPKKGLF